MELDVANLMAIHMGEANAVDEPELIFECSEL